MFGTNELKKIFQEKKKLTQAVSTVVTSIVTELKNNYTATTDPTNENDYNEGYSVGSVWINKSTNKVFQCTDNAINTAVWKNLSSTITDDAPADGEVYGRKNGAWFLFEGGSGGLSSFIFSFEFGLDLLSIDTTTTTLVYSL